MPHFKSFAHITRPYANDRQALSFFTRIIFHTMTPGPNIVIGFTAKPGTNTETFPQIKELNLIQN